MKMPTETTYPDEACFFEVIALSEEHVGGGVEIGDHVEGAGPCCLGTDGEWKHGIVTINNPGGLAEEDEYWAIGHLRPLTSEAHAMYDRILAGRSL